MLYLVNCLLSTQEKFELLILRIEKLLLSFTSKITMFYENWSYAFAVKHKMRILI